MDAIGRGTLGAEEFSRFSSGILDCSLCAVVWLPEIPIPSPFPWLLSIPWCPAQPRRAAEDRTQNPPRLPPAFQTQQFLQGLTGSRLVLTSFPRGPIASGGVFLNWNNQLLGKNKNPSCDYHPCSSPQRLGFSNAIWELMANPEPKEQNLCTVAVTPKTFRHSVLSLGFARSGPHLQNPSREDGNGNGRKQSFVHKEILIQVRFPLIR